MIAPVHGRGIVFRAGRRKSDELTERAIIGRLKIVTRQAAVELVVTRGMGKHVEQFSISDQHAREKNFLGNAINIACHFTGGRRQHWKIMPPWRIHAN